MWYVVGVEQTDLSIFAKLKSFYVVGIMFTTIPRIDPSAWNIFPEVSLSPVMIVIASFEESFEYGFRILDNIFVDMFT
jgi:hypothetical protein